MISRNRVTSQTTRATMDSGKQRIQGQTGFALIETVISAAILLIAVIGASGFRYYTALEARKAAAQITAARIGLLLCESWRGLSGDEDYNPATHLSSTLTIDEGAGPDEPEDFTPLGSYAITLDGVNYYTTLSWKEETPGLRALNIIVTWDQRDQGQSDIDDADKSLSLTSFAATED
jgi:Tfp pilus assembly protein PilV